MARRIIGSKTYQSFLAVLSLVSLEIDFNFKEIPTV